MFIPAPQSGSPMTYSIDGRQYIIVAVSGGNYSGEYIAFALPNSATQGNRRGTIAEGRIAKGKLQRANLSPGAQAFGPVTIGLGIGDWSRPVPPIARRAKADGSSRATEPFRRRCYTVVSESNAEDTPRLHAKSLDLTGVQFAASSAEHSHNGTRIGFGPRLRHERERREISLKSIADNTKISRSLLEALERDDVSRWPTGIFRRAFVRSYAEAIGLNGGRGRSRVRRAVPGSGHASPAKPTAERAQVNRAGARRRLGPR